MSDYTPDQLELLNADPLALLTREELLERIDQVNARLLDFDRQLMVLTVKVDSIESSRQVKLAYLEDLQKHLADLGG